MTPAVEHPASPRKGIKLIEKEKFYVLLEKVFVKINRHYLIWYFLTYQQGKA
jgi:hypothetical protein